MSERDRLIGGVGIFAIVTISVGIGGAFGWPFGLMCVGAFALIVSLGAS